MWPGSRSTRWLRAESTITSAAAFIAIRPTPAGWFPTSKKCCTTTRCLAAAYLEAFQLTGDDEYARVVRETLDYVLAEMTDPSGGFYSTQDADSEGVEGKFFVWSQEEIIDVLGREDARLFIASYDVTVDGNWDGQNILNRTETDARLSEMLNVEESALRESLARSRKKLHDVRSLRIPPGRDEKVLVSWNGLMIAAMAQAASVFDEPKYAAAARAAADFILQSMRTDDGQLLHAYKDGRAPISRVSRRLCRSHRRAGRPVRGDVRCTLRR